MATAGGGARAATTGRGQRPRDADGLSGFELGDKALGHLHAVADDGILRGVEDGGIGVFVDGEDGLGTADTCQVLNGTGDAQTDEQLRRNGDACLANLMAILEPAGFDQGTRAADFCPQQLC